MSGKTLSSSTLSLRFMQNAQRARNMKEFELEKAEVHDDAQWDVGQEVREAWGLVSEQNEPQRIAHETSFLPFLFSDPAKAISESDPAPKLPTGRRKFTNAVEEEAEKEPTEQQEPEEIPTPALGQKEKTGRSRVHPHPVPIQSISGKLLHGLPPLKSKPSKESKSARDAIFDNSGVGTDLRAAKRRTMEKMDDVDGHASTSFLKPSGIDTPPMTSKSKIPEGAREKNHKRTREATEETDEGVKKFKKKKKAT